MHPGQGPGLSLHDLGETGGSETVTLLQSEIPAHTHAMLTSSASGDEEGLKNPANAAPGAVPPVNAFYGPLSGKLVSLAAEALAAAGGERPHHHLQPYLTFYFCIALQGVFPPRG